MEAKLRAKGWIKDEPVTVPVAKRPKYGNRKVERHGIKFDSVLEADVYDDLLIQYGPHRILRQASFYIAPGAVTVRIQPDFVIIRDIIDGLPLFEFIDAKGVQSQAWRSKAKTFTQSFGFKLLLAKRDRGQIVYEQFH